MAAGEPAAEFSERFTHAARRPRRNPEDKIVEFVTRGLRLGFGRRPDGTYEQVWFKEIVAPDEVAFEPACSCSTRAKAQALKAGPDRATARRSPDGKRHRPCQHRNRHQSVAKP